LTVSPTVRVPRSAPRVGDALRFKVDIGYGRLYVSGPDARRVASLVKGSYYNARKRSYELSLTLETLVGIKELGQMSSRALASRCTNGVMRWARAARRSHEAVVDLHKEIDGGYRTALPWHDSDRDDRPPFAHQEIMATVASAISGSAFLAEMGTGKTRAAIEAMSHHARGKVVDMFLVVCPVAVMSTWERELVMWSDNLEPVRLDGPVKERDKWIRLTAEAMRQDGFLVPKVPVAIVNYEVLAKLADTIVAADIRWGIILDEGHRIRNPTAKVSKAAMRIAGHAAWRLLMTGTPILNGLHNVWSQWYFVDLGVTFGANYVQFRREFFSENQWTMKLEPLDGVVDDFNGRLHVRGLRFRKEDCLDLPPKIYEVHEVEMAREQAAAYRDMRDQLLVDLESMDQDEEGTASASIILTQILRLTQITSGFLPRDADDPDSKPYLFDPNPKLNALDEIVREQVADDRSVIVWAWYRQDVARIAEKLADLSPVRIVGGMTRQGREDAEKGFQSGEAKVLIGNPASAGVGLNLQAASVAIYYSQGYNLEHRAQSEDRCHRSGSEVHKSVTYIDLSCRDTIDEVVRNALAGKLALAEAVVELREAL
jgi:SNF2 family DNA or RNA helicase